MIASRTLFIDADDTLWEDGRYFAEADRDFYQLMASLGYEAEVVSPLFWQANEKRRLVVGYGAYAFADAMFDAYQELNSDPQPEVIELLNAIGRTLIYHPINFLEGVRETLPKLKELGSLIMVTQGDTRYQSRKIKESGIEEHFNLIEIVPQKNSQTYRDLLKKHGLIPANTFMVGNSPACDINPALSAGMKAIYIPNPYTWKIDLVPITAEHMELPCFKHIYDYFHSLST